MAKQETLWGDTVEIQDASMVGNLSKRFVVPPFSVLDTRQGYWQERKRQWIALGIKSELGRDAEISGGSPLLRGEISYAKHSLGGTSIFDPVLCELIYRWFCPVGGLILDPFAGGSVRGIVAGFLGYNYIGIELRPEQVEANRQQKKTIQLKGNVSWVVGDGIDVIELAPYDFDFLFTCPPYYNLEIYSDLPGELSALETYAEFRAAYETILIRACSLLAEDAFICLVVANIRADKDAYYNPISDAVVVVEKGAYYDLVGDTISIMRNEGLQFYNDGILVNPAGTLPIRVSAQFDSGRKLGKTHQNVLVFVKGDWRKATELAVRGKQ